MIEMNKKIEEGPSIQNDSLTTGSVFMDFLTVLTNYRKFISRFVVLCTIGTMMVVIVLPKWYKSVASVFPAEKADLLGGLEGIASLAKSFSPTRALSALGGNQETDRYMAILKSKTVLGAVINKFDLVHVYDITDYPIEKTTKELLENVEFQIEDEGYITITVYDKEPQRSADMANFFVEMLNKTNTELQVKNARGNRGFIEERYKKNLVDLAAAEDSLKKFQKKYGVIALPEQIEASIKAIAEITGDLALKEVKASVLKRTQSDENPLVIAAKIEVDEIQKKLAQMNSGTHVPESEMKVFVPFNRMPDLGGEYIRRFREVEIQYKILQFLTPLYEQAKVEERRQTPSVIILDKAIPAERKAKPKISLYTLIALIISSLLSLLTVFFLEWLKRLRDMDPDRFIAFIGYFKSDWFGLRWRNKNEK
jgi:tyrosine-protein kinase Etk/Wzc